MSTTSEKMLRRMVRRFMTNWGHEYDGPTALSEAAACDCDHDEWLDDETHWIWDFALRYAPYE